jgi:alpha-galactosidase
MRLTRQLWISSVIIAAFVCAPMAAQGFAQAVPLAQSPPMGWNDWYQYKCTVSDAIVRANADGLVSTGMKTAGYTHISIDDCWQGKRDGDGNIHPNSRFPDMKALADYIHRKGLKFGIYSSPGPKTCAGYEGSYGHEEQDARTYARWGVDLLKYDWCSAARVYKPDQMQAAYRKMGEALRRTGRPIVYSLCQYGLQAVWRWGASVGGNMWRTTDDIGGDYYRVSMFGFMQNGLAPFAGPGHWNDPDILQIGIGKLNHDEELTQMSLWCLLAAPLQAGNNLAHMSKDTLAILTNPEVIAVDQDPKGVEGHRAWQEGPLEIWVKPLADGSKAVGLFNRGMGLLPITLHFKDIVMPDSVDVRDLWARRDLGTFHSSYTATVPRHGAVMLKVK